MDTFKSKSVISSGAIIVVACAVAVVPSFESIRPEMIQFLTLIGMTLIAGHKGKDIMLAKYGDGQDTSA